MRIVRRAGVIVVSALVAAGCRAPATLGGGEGGEGARPTALVAKASAEGYVAPPVGAGTEAAGSPYRLDIAYRVAMPDPASHLYDVQIDVAGVRDSVLELQLPVWSPGRYARFDFARNLQELQVTSGGAPVRWDRINGSLWRLHTPGTARVTVRYRAFWNTLSGTYSVLDTAHANWNGASLFMYVVGHKADPVRLHIQAPGGWHIMNGDTRTPDQSDYTFENYDRLIDTPTEVAPTFLVDSFTVDGRLYRTMVHHNGAPPQVVRRKFVRDVEKLVRYENSVFGPPPLQSYTFLFNIGYPGGDGMEHLYSTQIISRNHWSDTAGLIPGVGTAAHEYFHVWNVKRVRPLLLGPFDYTSERYQPSLWVAEGWTQYYGEAAPSRAGVLPRDDFLGSMAGIIRDNLTAPGRKEVSARMASFEAPFWDGANGNYATNGRNTFISYYTKGAGIALYLDLFIRAKTGNAHSLDDAFRNLQRRSWEQPNASYYLQGRGYTEDDVEQAVSEAAGTSLRDWFDRHVGGTEDMNYDEVLGWAGLRLVRDDAASWRLEPVAGATEAQARVREGWMSGRTSAPR